MTDSARRPGPIELLIALGVLVAFLGWRGLSAPRAFGAATLLAGLAAAWVVAGGPGRSLGFQQGLLWLPAACATFVFASVVEVRPSWVEDWALDGDRLYALRRAGDVSEVVDVDGHRAVFRYWRSDIVGRPTTYVLQGDLFVSRRRFVVRHPQPSSPDGAARGAVWQDGLLQALPGEATRDDRNIRRPLSPDGRLLLTADSVELDGRGRSWPDTLPGSCSLWALDGARVLASDADGAGVLDLLTEAWLWRWSRTLDLSDSPHHHRYDHLLEPWFVAQEWRDEIAVVDLATGTDRRFTIPGDEGSFSLTWGAGTYIYMNGQRLDLRTGRTELSGTHRAHRAIVTPSLSVSLGQHPRLPPIAERALWSVLLALAATAMGCWSLCIRRPGWRWRTLAGGAALAAIAFALDLDDRFYWLTFFD